MENTHYVYSHTRLDTNTIFYIGIGKGKNRYRAKNTKARTLHWKNITNKTSYRIDILFDKLTQEEACKKEIELIAFYGRKDRGTGLLVNFTDGGEGRLGSQEKYTPIVEYSTEGVFIKQWRNVPDIVIARSVPRQSLYSSLNNKRLTTDGSLWFYNSDFSENLLASKIDEITKWKDNKSSLCKTKIAVDQYSKADIFIQTYSSIKEASFLTSTSETGISLVLSGRLKTSNKFKWKKHEE